MSRRTRRRKGLQSHALPRKAGDTPAKPKQATLLPEAPGRTERLLRFALFAALGLLLLTPFVVTRGTVFPYVVGKALWSRSLIEIAFALWAVLALTRPGYRPPRSWLLVLLGLGLGVSALSAAFGVNPQYSLWSDYERMLGLIDQAHWFVLAAVLASVLRSGRAWRALLGANVAAGTAMACLVIARALDIEVPFYGALPEASASRLGGPFGNPSFLSVYLLANLVLAAGFAARAWSARPPLGWLAAAALHLAGLFLAGSVGGFAGLLAAVGLAALAFAWLARRRARLAAVVLLAAIALGGAGLGARFFEPGRAVVAAVQGPALEWPGGRALRYMGQVHLTRPSVQSRLAAWEAGLAGFAARPLLGFGPGNYRTVFGLYGSGYAATSEPHDLAHGKLIEVAAATGAAGLAAWLAMWWLALAVLLGAARTMAGPQRAFAVFAAAALAGHLVQVQFLFDTSAGSLLATLLLAYAATLESRVLPPSWRARFPGGLAALFAPRTHARKSVHRRGARAMLAAAAVVLALCGLVLNRTILAAADERHVALESIPSGVLAEGIEAFPPLAGFYRRFLFAELALNWPGLRAQEPAFAAALLQRADREAAEAVRAEPWNWRLEHRLARLYRAVADTDPDYRATAQRHLSRARELAPARDVFPEPLDPPGDLAAEPLPGERIELRWRPSPGAGYHQIARTAEPGAWRTVLYAYGPERRTFTAPAGALRYRIKACRHPGDCSAWEAWP